MNYRHIYHAGNFADVVKHSILTLLLEYLHNKETPYCFIDTHAGEACYGLCSTESQKTEEAKLGIQRLLHDAGRIPDSIQTYLRLVQQNFNVNSELVYYPGSSELAYHLLRYHDRMIINEYHRETYQNLKKHFRGKRNVAIHQRDAYEFLPAILPPREKRGIVLIDPPYENKTELTQVNDVLLKSLKRWPQAIYCIWSPITVDESPQLKSIINKNELEKYLIIEFTICKPIDKEKGLIGCMMLVINPPWVLPKRLNELLKYLWEIFATNGRGQYLVENP